MKKKMLVLTILLLLAACAPPAEAGGQEMQMDATPLPQPSETAALPVVETLAPEVEQVQDQVAQEGVNPLTGLVVADPSLLERRPILVKVQNVPRESRPHWGLSMADIVYEYYIEYGDTRFAALYYGQDSPLVGPIRSARHVDIHLVQMYQSFLIFGGAYDDLFELLLASDFAERLIREGPNTAAALGRFDPYGVNYLLADTSKVKEVIALYGMDDKRPNLEGMSFSDAVPEGGQTADDLYVRFSGGMYSHWQFDPARGGYVRYSDAENDFDRNNPVYVLQTDRQTGEPIVAENVVMLLAPYIELVEETESSAGVYDIDLVGRGEAFLARDGILQAVFWVRENNEDVITLVDADGKPVGFKPGRTWFEVLGKSSQVQPDGGSWQFNFLRP